MQCYDENGRKTKCPPANISGLIMMAMGFVALVWMIVVIVKTLFF